MSYEKDILKSIENDEWKTASNKQSLINELQQTARNTMLKDKRMNIRISKRDLERLKTKALEEGIPYQTLVTSIIHKYINGYLKE